MTDGLVRPPNKEIMRSEFRYAINSIIEYAAKIYGVESAATDTNAILDSVIDLLDRKFRHLPARRDG